MKRVTVLTCTVALVLALTAGVALAATLVGTPGPDNINGTNNADTVSSRAGNDRIAAKGGPDVANGNAGDDRVYGEEGNDTLRGDVGDDYIVGSGGNDTIYGGPDDDRTRGVGGNDEILVAGDASNVDYVNCGAGTDTARVDTNDVVDGILAETILVNSAISCETLYVNGILIPNVV